MELKRILVAVNSVNDRDAAFERALTLARSSGAELYLLYAVPTNLPFAFRAAERLKRMTDLRQRAEDAGVHAQTVEQPGDPAGIIELHANARGADLIVMGSEARRGWGRHRSLVAERVIRRTNVPTLVVASNTSDSPIAFKNVLVAVDLSPASKDVLRSAVELTAAEAVQLTVLHTVTGLEAADDVRTLEAVVSAVPAGVDTRIQVLTGSAAHTILDHAADIHADLVVVGRSRGFKMLGSTTLRVLRKNDRSLLVIPSAFQRTARAEWQGAA